MAKKNNKSAAPRKIESTPKKGSPVKASKQQPVGIDLTPAATPASPTKGRKANDGARKAAGAPMINRAATYEQIAARAYQIWEAKGRPDGQDEQNWREAEEQLRTEAVQA